MSRHDPRCAPERFIEAKAEALAAQLAEGREVAFCGSGPIATQLHDALAMHGVYGRCFVDINPKRIGGRKRDLPVVAMSAVGALCDEGVLLLGAVGRRGGRGRLRAALCAEGLVEGPDFLLCA